MDSIMNKIQYSFEYSEHELKIIRFMLTAIVYDVSKLIIFIVFFCYTGHFLHFLFSIVPLILLRTKLGGLHLRSYLLCLVTTFIYLCSAIYILPCILSPHPLFIFVILLFCAITCYLIGPNSLTRKAPKNERYIKVAKLESFHLILIIAILFFVFSANEYLIVSFWTIVLHTIQLSISKVIKEV